MFPTPEQMRTHESAWFAHSGNVSAALAEAGAGIARVIASQFPSAGTLFLFLGHGHNAADAIVAASHLASSGWTVRHHLFSDPQRLAPLTHEHFQNLAPHSSEFSIESPDASLPRPWLAIDALCGIGVRLPLNPSFADAVTTINKWRSCLGSRTIAIDIPSGLDAATGTPSDPCVTADLTITLADVKRGLLLAGNHTGALALVPLKSLPPCPQDSIPEEILITPHWLAPHFAPRPHALHKGQAGRLAMIAGSPGLTGAAALAALGALHGGAGLVSVFTHQSIVSEVAARCPLEAMVRPLPEGGLSHFPFEDFDAIAIGPGLGRSLDAALPAFVRRCPLPMVVDADALNGLARQCQSNALPFANPPSARILTPHPGEFARLAPDLSSYPRADAAVAFSERFPGTTLLFKGQFTIVARSNRQLAYNPTGNNGLATGGSGDILTGLTAALLIRQPDPWLAACAAAWLHGRAAEIACTYGNETTESLLPSTTAHWLGHAFRSLATTNA